MTNGKNLAPVTGRPFYAECLACRETKLFGDVVDQNDQPIGGFADLNGEPFKAYYCSSCAGKRLKVDAKGGE